MRPSLVDLGGRKIFLYNCYTLHVKNFGNCQLIMAAKWRLISKFVVHGAFRNIATAR